jgi:hypothetical protein
MRLDHPNQPLIPSVTVTEATFGDRALIALFRGAGDLVGFSSSTGNSGIAELNDRLQARFADYYIVSQVFDSYEGNVFSFREVGSVQGREFIQQFDGTEPLGIVGYSAGGLSSIRLAQTQAPRTVNVLVQIDSYEPLTGTSPADEVLPSNVAKGINYYQNANRLNPLAPDFDLLDLQGAREVAGSENINAEDFVEDNSLTHRSIINSTRLQNEILTDLETFVLQDLSFDPAAELVLSGGAQLVNNTLALASEIEPSIGQAILPIAFDIDPDFSFSSQFEFRLSSDPAGVLPGFSFWLQPTSIPSVGITATPLAIAFNPISSTLSPIADNAIAVITPDITNAPLSQAIASLDLDTGSPITAWVDYDGSTDQLAVFLSDTLTQPSTPTLTTTLDLPNLVGNEVQFGLQASVGNERRQADLLTWELTTTEFDHQPPARIPTTYLNFELTQQAASTLLGLDLPAIPFAVGGLEFTTLFDEAAYLQLNSDVVRAIAQGLFETGYDHFTQFGWREGRNPSSLYDEAFYLGTHLDVANAVTAGAFTSGFEHFVQFGHLEGRDPSAQFDQDDYLTLNPDVAAAVDQGAFLSGFEHYVEFGAAEGRNPQHLLFQAGYYLAQNPDVAEAVAAGAFTNGFDHYLRFGCREGRNPALSFSETEYLAANPDVAAAVDSGDLTCGWVHNWLLGRFEARG